ADDRVGASVLGDRREDVALDVDALEDGLLDEVDVGDGVLEGLAGGDVLRDEIRGAGRVQALLLEVARLLSQALERGVRVLDADVRDGPPEPGDREDLGDAAAHVARADDGHGGDGHGGTPSSEWIALGVRGAAAADLPVW